MQNEIIDNKIKWEYKIIPIDFDFTKSSLIEELNKLGQDGWECYYYNHQTYKYYFKRQTQYINTSQRHSMENRIIKFRGKRIDNGEWVYGYYVKDPQGKCRIYWQPFDEATNHTYHFVTPESVGQFTGLKDKNGVGWFDGDLVQANKNAPVHETYWSFPHNGWRIKLDNGVSFELNSRVFEIIGNTTDNPELTK